MLGTNSGGELSQVHQEGLGMEFPPDLEIRFWILYWPHIQITLHTTVDNPHYLVIRSTLPQGPHVTFTVPDAFTVNTTLLLRLANESLTSLWNCMYNVGNILHLRLNMADGMFPHTVRMVTPSGGEIVATWA